MTAAIYPNTSATPIYTKRAGFFQASAVSACMHSLGIHADTPRDTRLSGVFYHTQHPRHHRVSGSSSFSLLRMPCPFQKDDPGSNNKLPRSLWCVSGMNTRGWTILVSRKQCCAHLFDAARRTVDRTPIRRCGKRDGPSADVDTKAVHLSPLNCHIFFSVSLLSYRFFFSPTG